MKYSKKIRGMSTALAFAFAFMVFSFSFAPKAHASEYTGSANFGWKTTSSNSSYTTFHSQAADLPVINKTQRGYLWYDYTGQSWGDFSVNLGATTEFSSKVKLYASYYAVRSNDVSPVVISDNFLDPTTWVVSYINTYGQTGYVEGGASVFKAFTPAVTGVINESGYAIECEWTANDIYPIRNLDVSREYGAGYYRTFEAVNPVQQIDLVIPSLRVIATAYSEEMEALDNVANQIIAQNDILQAMKGDIVAILQDIYTMTGDMYIAQNLLNSYIAQMLPLLESIDRTTANIYSLLSSQLAALETAINTSASTIEAAIEAQTAAMIAYLEEMFNTGNEVPDETYQQQQDAENILDQMESLEKPDVETIVPEIDDYSDGGVSGVMSAIFSSNLIVTMMTLSASLAFGAYVLFGKRS